MECSMRVTRSWYTNPFLLSKSGQMIELKVNELFMNIQKDVHQLSASTGTMHINSNGFIAFD